MNEILSALFTLYPATEYYPYLIKCLEMLTDLMESTNNYVPLLCKFKLLLSNKFFYRNQKTKKAKEFDFEVNIKCLQDNYKNNRYWSDLLNRILALITRNLACYINSPFFEDYSMKYLRLLKRVYKVKNLTERKNSIKDTVRLKDISDKQGFALV